MDYIPFTFLNKVPKYLHENSKFEDNLLGNLAEISGIIWFMIFALYFLFSSNAASHQESFSTCLN